MGERWFYVYFTTHCYSAFYIDMNGVYPLNYWLQIFDETNLDDLIKHSEKIDIGNSSDDQK